MHDLGSRWTFYFRRDIKEVKDYGETIHPIGSFSTVEDFWGYFAHIKRPDCISENIEYHLFKNGIRGLWEDDVNRNGGKWFVLVKKEYSAQYWERASIALIGEALPESIVGAVLAMAADIHILSLWTVSSKTPENDETFAIEAESIANALGLPAGVTLRFKSHCSIRKEIRGKYSFVVKPKQ